MSLNPGVNNTTWLQTQTLAIGMYGQADICVEDRK